ncbi:hypothetical protein K505DRAFT_368957 [Melanomma pulvis-pyrius CBS 109.77]|uniref:Uncharacterized protein n=1 Tax=Melanomma pulvis-pyrius CBS 109.77 TaxID=1314802 RepID=A0A6A6WP73_9PLEO|nr:hypothetical protein K505DRAFT_368957 [Melanomma pulvis-pyrius CBS 109.77]
MTSRNAPPGPSCSTLRPRPRTLPRRSGWATTVALSMYGVRGSPSTRQTSYLRFGVVAKPRGPSRTNRRPENSAQSLPLLAADRTALNSEPPLWMATSMSLHGHFPEINVTSPTLVKRSLRPRRVAKPCLVLLSSQTNCRRRLESALCIAAMMDS